MLSLKIVKGAELAEGVADEMRVAPTQTRFVIGRDPSTHWPIPDRTLAISARHCEIVATPAGVALRDLSTNGTFVNGGAARIAGDHLLGDGDRIELGPYTIVVQGAPARAAAVPTRAELSPGAAVPAFQSPSVEAPAPLRGGDPAAMLAGVRPPREGLTEILRNAPPPDESGLELTKIRIAPKAAPAVPQAPSTAATAEAAPVSPPAAARPAKAAATTAEAGATALSMATMGRDGAAAGDVLTSLALGLGLPSDALAGRDPAQAAAQVATLARAGVAALRQLLEQQVHLRRQIGSRATALAPVRNVNPLHLAPSDAAALQMLLGSGAEALAPLQRAAAELAAHQGNVLAAFREAASRLGDEISPSTLQAALGAAGGGEARLWQLYAQVWHRAGLASDQPWSQGFVEAALLHLAAAFDEQR